MVPHPFLSVAELHHRREVCSHNTQSNQDIKGFINEYQWQTANHIVADVCVMWLLPYAEVCRRRRMSCCLCSLYPAFLLEEEQRAHFLMCSKEEVIQESVLDPIFPQGNWKGRAAVNASPRGTYASEERRTWENCLITRFQALCCGNQTPQYFLLQSVQ